MAAPPPKDLTRREREVIDIIYRLGQATANEVMAEMEDPPSYSSVRSVLRHLENKGHLTHEADGARHVYTPVVRRDRASRSALKHLLATFFDDSPEQVVTALLDVSKSKLSKEELAKIDKLVKQAKREGR
ncbi:MAG: BlaI/MecI/CopY family transcriptional regulator [Planctomycetota bacterium]